MAKVNSEFKPGEKVPNSGIYRVVHDSEHHTEHEVTAIKGKRFPPCRNCGVRVRFILKRKAKHIESHPEFEGQKAKTPLRPHAQ